MSEKIELMPNQRYLIFDDFYELPWRIYKSPYGCDGAFDTEQEAKKYAKTQNFELVNPTKKK